MIESSMGMVARNVELPSNKSKEKEKRDEERTVNSILEESSGWQEFMANPSVQSEKLSASHKLPFLFCYGGKQIWLNILSENSKFKATTFVLTRESTKKPNETKLLYMAVKMAMQQIASNLNAPIEYQALTDNKNMKNWAMSRSHGGGVFDWDEWGRNESPEGYKFEKTFYPADDAKTDDAPKLRVVK